MCQFTMDTRLVLFFVFIFGIVHCKLVNLSCKDISRFVNGHNTRRLHLAKGNVTGQPAASKMNSVVWDDELATMAAGWAKNEKYGHNPQRTLASGRFDVGENLYLSSTTNLNKVFNVDKALDSWFIEHKKYKFGPLTESDFLKEGDDQIGHYTQMAWSDTVYIGCALSKYRHGRFMKHYVVCNYGPAGNYLREVPYKSGPPSGRLQCGAKSCTKPYGPSC